MRTVERVNKCCQMISQLACVLSDSPATAAKLVSIPSHEKDHSEIQFYKFYHLFGNSGFSQTMLKKL